MLVLLLGQGLSRELLHFDQLDLQQLGIEGKFAGQKQGDAQGRRQARERKEQVGGQQRHPKWADLEHDLRQHGQEGAGKPRPDNPSPALPLPQGPPRQAQLFGRRQHQRGQVAEQPPSKQVERNKNQQAAKA